MTERAEKIDQVILGQRAIDAHSGGGRRTVELFQHHDENGDVIHIVPDRRFDVPLMRVLARAASTILSHLEALPRRAEESSAPLLQTSGYVLAEAKKVLPHTVTRYSPDMHCLVAELNQEIQDIYVNLAAHKFPMSIWIGHAQALNAVRGVMEYVEGQAPGLADRVMTTPIHYPLRSEAGLPTDNVPGTITRPAPAA